MLIDIKDLSFSYKSKDKNTIEVFDNFSLSIEKPYKKICITGPDGAGKSTLLKLLAGVLKPATGSIFVKDIKPDTNNRHFIESISYMSQTLGLYKELSVMDNLTIFSGLKGLDVKNNTEYLHSLLKKVDLLQFKDREFDALSGGMKQKIALLCTIASKPDILILDEPTVGVDPLSRKEIFSLIDDYLKENENSCCIFTSAYLDEAEKSDYTMIVEDAKVVLKGETPTLYKGFEDKTYYLLFKNEKTPNIRELFQLTKRYLCNSPIIDLTPRLSQIFITLDERASFNEAYSFLKEHINYDFEIKKRECSLEDVYISFSMKSYEAGSLDFINTQRQDLPLISENKENLKNIDGCVNIDCCENCDNLENSQRKIIAKASFSTDITENTRSSKNTDDIVVHVKNINKHFGSFIAVDNSSFDVKRGEIFGLLGPNGAGKTTTFRMICALLTPTHGEILVNGYNLAKAKTDARKTIGYVSQKFSLYQNLSAKENLVYFARSYGLKGKEQKERIAKIVKDFALEKFLKIKSGELPFGVQRQLSMACALLHRPKILFLDEATSGADPLARRKFFDKVLELSNQGTSVIVTTHFMEEAEYCDRFLIQDRGKILISGDPKEKCVKNGKRISVQDAFIDLIENSRNKGDMSNV